LPQPQLLNLPLHTVFYRRLFPGCWADAEGRPFKNEFDFRDEESGLSVFLESDCSESDVMADGPEGSGLVIFVYEDISPCFAAYESETHPNPTLAAAHVELRLSSDPTKRRVPKPKQRALASLAAIGLIRRPAPKDRQRA
jgi:hypothetical protein